MHLSPGMTVDKVRAVSKPGVLIHRDLTDDGIFDNIEFARGKRVGQKQIDGASQSIPPHRIAPFRYLNALFVGEFGEALNGFGVRREIHLNEISVGKLRPSFLATNYTKNFFDARIIGRHVGEAYGPVVTGAIYFARLEFVIA